jgi:hypothetical protein
VSTAPVHDPCLTVYNPNCHKKGKSSNLITFAVYRLLGIDHDSSSKKRSWEVMECDISTVAYSYSDISVRNNQLNIGRTETTPLLRVSQGDDTNISTMEHPMYLEPSDNSRRFAINYVDWQNLLGFLTTKVFSGSLANGESSYSNETGLAAIALQHANITKAADDIALSMTNYIRTGRNATEAQGAALRVETFVIVRWAWLILPIATVLAAGVFLLLTMIQTSRRGEPLWKSSTAALMSHQIAGWNAVDFSSVRNQTQLDEMARGVRLQLARGDHLRFVKV